MLGILTEDQYLLFKSYHERELCWGSLHIVMDDGNLEDSNVQFCMNWARVENDADGFMIAVILSEKTIEERQKLYEHF